MSTEGGKLRQGLIDPRMAVDETGKPVLELAQRYNPSLDGEYLRELLQKINSHDALVEALEAYDKAAIALTDQQLIDNQPLMSAIAQGREALKAAGKGK